MNEAYRFVLNFFRSISSEKKRTYVRIFLTINFWWTKFESYFAYIELIERDNSSLFIVRRTIRLKFFVQFRIKKVYIYIYIYIFAIFDERNSNRISFKQIRERDNSDMLCVSAISLSVSFLSWTRRTIRFKFFVRFRINVTYMYFCNFWWTKYIHVKGHCLKDIVCWRLSVIFSYECFFAKLDLFFRFNVRFFSWYEEAVWKLLSREQLGIISYDTLYLFVY